MTERTMLDAALAYARRGWAVFPLVPGTKVPHKGSRGCDGATTDVDKIHQWWTKHPQDNIGVNVGKSGLVVIDVDPRSGGDETWHDLKQEHGINDDTVIGLTGGGGTHLLYKQNGHDPAHLKAKLGEGVDVKRGNSYIIVAPSVHPDGPTYEWDVGAHPDDQDLIPLPPSLAELLKSDARATCARPVGEVIPEGQRDDTLMSLAGTMRRRGMGEAAILAALLEENKRCVPPLSHKDVERIAHSAARYEPAVQPAQGQEQRQKQRPIGERIPGYQAEKIKTLAPTPPDLEFRKQILGALRELNEEGTKRLPADIRRENAGTLLLEWLARHGEFVQSSSADLFYLYRPGRRLYNLDTDLWAAWLYAATGANPAGTDFAHLAADCKAAAMTAPKHNVVRVAAWDDVARVLRVSRFDGTVYVLDGEEIYEESNGENVLFNDDPTWLPYTPDFGNAGALYWHTSELPNWPEKDNRGLALRAWILSTFFTELCPTRPMAVTIGEKGSGKTMLWRLLLRFLFGHLAEVSGVPDRPDGFTAGAAAAHVLVVDNLDDFRGWMRDKLARLSTGAVDEYRKLYTSNEVGRVRYRCWLAFTSRTPDTLRRDDLADRLLLLPVERLEAGAVQAERDFLRQTEVLRAGWWGDVLARLNQIVAAIRCGKLQSRATLRMADWESLGRLVADIEGAGEEWSEFVQKLSGAQADFLLEGELIVEGLNLWVDQDRPDTQGGTLKGNHGREVTAKILYQELTELLFGDKKPPADWPRSTVSFGKRLSTIRRELRTYWEVEWGKSTAVETRGCISYQFWPLGEGQRKLLPNEKEILS